MPGGDADPAGDYKDALAMLEDLPRSGSPFADVGITGYPESHPTIHDDLTVQSMWDKRQHATHIVSNLTFDPAVVKRLAPPAARCAASRCRCCSACPGRSTATKLLGMATKIGVGESTRFLAKQKGLLARLVAPGGFTGESFLEQVRADPRRARGPRRGPARLHVQPGRRDRGLAHRTWLTAGGD